MLVEFAEVVERITDAARKLEADGRPLGVEPELGLVQAELFQDGEIVSVTVHCQRAADLHWGLNKKTMVGDAGLEPTTSAV